jgi:RimJ/RimL family protein N-acetyltransferase
MIDRFFSEDYEERASLRDGSTVLLRLVRPSDKEALQRGFELLSEHSRFLRFLVPKTALSDEELRYLTEVDGENHFAIGAVRVQEDGELGEGLGIARMIRYPDAPTVAEAAIAVTDAVHGCGLGTLLFMRLVAAGCERGLRRFRCEVHASNNAMKDLIAAVNPEFSIEVRAGVMSIEFELPPLTPEVLPSEPPRETSMYRFFQLAARKPSEWVNAALQLLKKYDDDKDDKDKDDKDKDDDDEDDDDEDDDDK